MYAVKTIAQEEIIGVPPTVTGAVGCAVMGSASEGFSRTKVCIHTRLNEEM